MGSLYRIVPLTDTLAKWKHRRVLGRFLRACFLHALLLDFEHFEYCVYFESVLEWVM